MTTQLDRVDEWHDEVPDLLIEELKQVLSKGAPEEGFEAHTYRSLLWFLIGVQIINNQQRNRQRYHLPRSVELLLMRFLELELRDLPFVLQLSLMSFLEMSVFPHLQWINPFYLGFVGESISLLLGTCLVLSLLRHLLGVVVHNSSQWV